MVGWLEDDATIPRVSAGVGGVGWIVVVALFGPELVDAVVLFATLVLVPAAVALLSPSGGDPRRRSVYRAAVLAQPAGAVGSVAAVVLGSGPMAALSTLPWLATMGLLAGYGLLRTFDRGLTPVGETLIDAGTVYGVVGPGSYFLYVLGIDLGFPTVIVQLTAAHFHYAGLVLPVVTGLAGRVIAPGAVYRVYRVAAWVVVAGMPAVAVGITLSHLAGVRLAELVGAVGFAAGTAVLAGVLVALSMAPDRAANRRLTGAARASLAVAGVALLWTMALAAGYGYARAFDPRLLSIGTMVRYHGVVNAFCFGPFGLLAWHLDGPGESSRAVADADQVRTSTS